MQKCDDCKFCDIDFEFDEEIEDEQEIWICSKGHDTDGDEECADYRKYRARKPKETYSECDSCKYCSECGNTIDCTTQYDSHRHYVKGMGFCWKDSEVRDV